MATAAVASFIVSINKPPKITLKRCLHFFVHVKKSRMYKQNTCVQSCLSAFINTKGAYFIDYTEPVNIRSAYVLGVSNL